MGGRNEEDSMHHGTTAGEPIFRYDDHHADTKGHERHLGEQPNRSPPFEHSIGANDPTSTTLRTRSYVRFCNEYNSLFPG